MIMLSRGTLTPCYLLVAGERNANLYMVYCDHDLSQDYRKKQQYVFVFSVLLVLPKSIYFSVSRHEKP